MIEVLPEMSLYDVNRLLTLECRDLLELVFEVFRFLAY